MLLTDIVRIELTEARNDQWAFYLVRAVASNGTRSKHPPVITVEQAVGRAAEWFPNATIAVLDPRSGATLREITPVTVRGYNDGD